jgi:hypothetical protein
MSNFRPDEFTVEARVIGDATNVTESDLATLPLRTVKYWAGEILYKVCCSHIETLKATPNPRMAGVAAGKRGNVTVGNAGLLVRLEWIPLIGLRVWARSLRNTVRRIHWKAASISNVSLR